MTAAPKKAPRTAAQAKATQAFQHAGTKAAAAKRKKYGATKSQKAASRKWAAAGRAAQAAVKAGKKKPATAKRAALPVSVLGTEPVLWLPGCNDELPVCAVVAVANHLLAATGVTATDKDMRALYELSGGGYGAAISSVLDAAADNGLAGVRLARYGITEEIGPGMIVGVQTRRGYHAVLSHAFGLVSWGLLLPRFGSPEEAWALEWDLDHLPRRRLYAAGTPIADAAGISGPDGQEPCGNTASTTGERMADEQPGDLTPMTMNCAIQHELFVTWQNVGFTEQQAFELVRTAVFAAFGGHF